MAKKNEITRRWEEGVPHDPRSVELYKSIEHLDWSIGEDSFHFKSGGDGDNGEHLMYLLDIHFAHKSPTPPESKDDDRVLYDATEVEALREQISSLQALVSASREVAKSEHDESVELQNVVNEQTRELFRLRNLVRQHAIDLRHLAVSDDTRHRQSIIERALFDLRQIAPKLAQISENTPEPPPGYTVTPCGSAGGLFLAKRVAGGFAQDYHHRYENAVRACWENLREREADPRNTNTMDEAAHWRAAFHAILTKPSREPVYTGGGACFQPHELRPDDLRAWAGVAPSPEKIVEAAARIPATGTKYLVRHKSTNTWWRGDGTFSPNLLDAALVTRATAEEWVDRRSTMTDSPNEDEIVDFEVKLQSAPKGSVAEFIWRSVCVMLGRYYKDDGEPLTVRVFDAFLASFSDASETMSSFSHYMHHVQSRWADNLRRALRGGTEFLSAE